MRAESRQPAMQERLPDIARSVARRSSLLGESALYALRSRLQLPIALQIAGERGVRWWASRWMGHFWSAMMGLLASLLPMTLAAVLLDPGQAPLLVMVALLTTALVTYSGDWIAGAAATVVSMIVFSWWHDSEAAGEQMSGFAAERSSLSAIAIGGFILALLIERLKTEGTVDRQEALAARSAATALSAVETVAATQQSLSPQAEHQLHEAIVRAVVGVNRAHAGALLLFDEETSDLLPAALYGFGAGAEPALLADVSRPGFIWQILTERRILQTSGLQRQGRTRYPHYRDIRLRSLLGAPVIGQEDRLLGVLTVGLLVDHRFPPQEMRKLEALATQVASILETMAVMGRRESQLRQARDEQRRLERLIAAVPEALIVSTPPSGAIVAMNTAAQLLFGPIEPDSLSGRVTPVHPDEGPHITPTEAAMTFGDVTSDVECLIRAADGQEIPVLASAAPIRDDDGSTWAVVTAFRDISALKEASRLKDEFVSVVSHELRSPLTPIRGFVQLVERELSREGGHERDVQRLKSVSGHVDRLTRLVDDLLDVSRLRSGSLEIRTELVDLVEIARRVIEVHATQEGEGRLSLESDCDQLVGEWDPDRIHQVLDNLVINGLKYGGTPPEVSIVIRRDADQAMIEVHDSGPGIDDYQREAIFGAFYRTPAALAGQVQGLGLGLYICRELVEAHGGGIDVRRGSPGGSIFEIRLPIIQQAADESNEQTRSAPELVPALSLPEDAFSELI